MGLDLGIRHLGQVQGMIEQGRELGREQGLWIGAQKHIKGENEDGKYKL